MIMVLALVLPMMEAMGQQESLGFIRLAGSPRKSPGPCAKTTVDRRDLWRFGLGDLRLYGP